LFLITAGHNLLSTFEVGLFAREGSCVQAEVLSYHFHQDSRSTELHGDVGFVEIKNVPSLPACDLGQFHIGEPTPQIPKGGELLFIAGCPESGFLPPERPSQVCVAVIAGYLCGGDERTLEIEYPESGHAVSPNGDSFRESDFFTTPRGFSGGGAWLLLKPTDGELFLPHKHVRMCGTDFCWYRRRRMLRVMRPRFSVPYFFDCHPELRGDYEHVLAALS
jgi:hypothetical protein